MDLKDKVVIVTGGKRIGRIVAQEVATRGADLVLSYRGSRQEAEDTVRDVQARGRRAIAVAADVSKAVDCAALVNAGREALGRIDVLVNMASVYGSTPFDELTEAGWDRDLAINLKSAFLCAKATVPPMRAAGGGRIVNFADWLARSGRPAYKGFSSMRSHPARFSPRRIWIPRKSPPWRRQHLWAAGAARSRLRKRCSR